MVIGPLAGCFRNISKHLGFIDRQVLIASRFVYRIRMFIKSPVDVLKGKTHSAMVRLTKCHSILISIIAYHTDCLIWFSLRHTYLMQFM